MMISKKIPVYALMMASLTISVTSCDSDDDNGTDEVVETPVLEQGLISLSARKVDFGKVAKTTAQKNAPEESRIVLTLTNNSDETLTSLDAAIEFPGKASVDLTFSPVAPGDSIDVPFTFAATNVEPGMYTGKATLTPSIGDPLEVELVAEVVENDADTTNKAISLSAYEVDFGKVLQSTTKKNAPTESRVELTLTNNSNETLTSLGSSIEFQGSAKVALTFSPVAPGDSITVPFTYAPTGLEPGVYTGKATLTPSIGDPIEVALKAEVVANPDNNNNKAISLSAYEVDFGKVLQSTTKKNVPTESRVELTLTNNSNETLTSLGSSIEFQGSAKVALTFSPVAPGDSITVPFTYAPTGLEPGVYTGKATLTPSIGDPIEVALKAEVVAN